LCGLKHADVREESATYLRLVDAWRNALGPQHVQFLLVAESHMAEISGDTDVGVTRPHTATAELPEAYCRLVHCFGYGEDALCTTPHPSKNSGTIQFWDIFGAVEWVHVIGSPADLKHQPTRALNGRWRP
jgi:hypothetical protein